MQAKNTNYDAKTHYHRLQTHIKKRGPFATIHHPNTPPKHMNINLVGTQSIWAGTEQKHLALT
jgi:hypothetical protein